MIEMQRVTLGNRPTNSNPNKPVIDYNFGDQMQWYGRVFFDILADNVLKLYVMQAQAFEVDMDGNFIPSPDGPPSRTDLTPHTVMQTAITARTNTMGPGWVRTLPPSQTTVDPSNLPEGTLTRTSLPAIGSVAIGQLVYVAPNLWLADEGEIRKCAMVKIDQLATVLANSVELSGGGFGDV